MGELLGQAGQAATQYKDIIQPAASIGMGAWQGAQQRKAMNQATDANMQAWRQNAFPSGATVNAMNQTARGNIGQARVGAYQNLGNELAARGFGPGSGIMAKGAGQIEGNYMKTLADSLSSITQFANTPQFGMPQGAFAQPTTGAMGGAVNQAGGLLDTAYGYRLMSDMLAKLGGTNKPREQEGQQ